MKAVPNGGRNLIGNCGIVQAKLTFAADRPGPVQSLPGRLTWSVDNWVVRDQGGESVLNVVDANFAIGPVALKGYLPQEAAEAAFGRSLSDLGAQNEP